MKRKEEIKNTSIDSLWLKNSGVNVTKRAIEIILPRDTLRVIIVCANSICRQDCHVWNHSRFRKFPEAILTSAISGYSSRTCQNIEVLKFLVIAERIPNFRHLNLSSVCYHFPIRITSNVDTSNARFIKLIKFKRLKRAREKPWNFRSDLPVS